MLDELSQQGGTATTNALVAGSIPTRQASVLTDLLAAAAVANYPIVSAWNQACAQAQGSSPLLVGAIAGIVPQLLVGMAQADTPLPSLTIGAAVNLLIDEMVATSATIGHGTPPAVGAQTAAIAAAPVGNPVFLWSVVDSAGRPLVQVVPETATVAITQDSQTGATAGQEPYIVTGQNAQGNRLSWDWLSSKYGSGASGAAALIDPSISNTGAGTGNLLVNGTFTTFTTTAVADNWNYAVGVATTNFTNGGTGNAYYTGQGSLGMLSAGGTKNAVTQSFAVPSTPTVSAGGTPYALVPSAETNTQYAVFVAVKLSAGTPTNGTLTADLITGDGTVGGSTVVADDASTNNTFAIDLTLLHDTLWHTFSGVFRLPKALATGPYKLRLAFTGTILDAGQIAYVNVGMAVMNPFYNGGPYFVGFRGSTNPNASGQFPDAWTFGITNTPGKLARAVWRYLDLASLGPQTPGLSIPATASPSISDALVS